MKMSDLETKLLASIVRRDEHWLCQAGLSANNRYGMMRFNGKPVHPHRLAAMLWLNYDINDNEHEICHIRSCQYKNCINPEHLYIGTRSENTLDSVCIKTHVSSRKTHCPQGHPYSPENTFLAQGRRRCRQCKTAHDRNYLARNKKGGI